MGTHFPSNTYSIFSVQFKCFITVVLLLAYKRGLSETSVVQSARAAVVLQNKFWIEVKCRAGWCCCAWLYYYCHHTLVLVVPNKPTMFDQHQSLPVLQSLASLWTKSGLTLTLTLPPTLSSNFFQEEWRFYSS